MKSIVKKKAFLIKPHVEHGALNIQKLLYRHKSSNLTLTVLKHGTRG